MNIELMYKDWNIEEMTGYKPITTFFSDLSIADAFGLDAIKETYNNVVKHWVGDYKYFTEFVMALNWKIWQHYESREDYADLYNELWNKAVDVVHANFNEDELKYYYRVTD